MNAFLLSGLISQYRSGQFVDACSNVILCGADEAASRKAFEEMLHSHEGGENPAPTKIEKIVGAPVQDQLLTEAGPSPINWPELAGEIQRSLESTAVDDQEHGYWVDEYNWPGPDKLAPDAAWLQRELPEDIRSGLNWSADKTYFFLISVLSPPTTPAEPAEDIELEEADAAHAAHRISMEVIAAFPQLAEKHLAVIARARNSVVAAWLWRKHAVGTPLARNKIRVDALCDVVEIGGKPE
jgi:hypothetical protein